MSPMHGLLALVERKGLLIVLNVPDHAYQSLDPLRKKFFPREAQPEIIPKHAQSIPCVAMDLERRSRHDKRFIVQRLSHHQLRVHASR